MTECSICCLNYTKIRYPNSVPKVRPKMYVVSVLNAIYLNFTMIRIACIVMLPGLSSLLWMSLQRHL